MTLDPIRIPLSSSVGVSYNKNHKIQEQFDFDSYITYEIKK